MNPIDRILTDQGVMILDGAIATTLRCQPVE